MVNGDNKRNNEITFPVLISLFQKQTNKSNVNEKENEKTGACF